MKQHQKGFTLLEMCVCLILFAIMLESLWGFFTHIYVNYMHFNRQTMLNREASSIEDYLSEYIRTADKIRITTDGGVIEVAGSTMNTEVNDAELEKIEVVIKTPKADGSGSDEKKSEVILESISPVEDGKGVYKLTYSVSGSSTKNLISDKIENIKVSSKQNSDIVVFECNLQKAGETNERLKVKKEFTESIAYKEAYSG